MKSTITQIENAARHLDYEAIHAPSTARAISLQQIAQTLRDLVRVFERESVPSIAVLKRVEGWLELGMTEDALDLVRAMLAEQGG
jgi:hypothetical protein